MRRAAAALSAWAEANLGHAFKDIDRLSQALSYGGPAFQRLEFLGDRVLGLAVAGLLLETYAHEDEGTIARRFAVLVARETLADVAARSGLAEVATLPGAGDPTAERARAGMLADAMEAVLGALYLDGGWGAARGAVLALWRPCLGAPGEDAPQDPKTRLQEWAQARGLGLPAYRPERLGGPDHAPNFAVTVMVTGLGEARALGPTKRAAERAAAEALLAKAAAS